MTTDLGSVLESAYWKSIKSSRAIAVYQYEKKYGWILFNLEAEKDARFICCFIEGECHATDTWAIQIEKGRLQLS